MSNRTPIEDIPLKTDKEANKTTKNSPTAILGEIPKDWNTDLVENIFDLENGSAREDRTSSRNSSETEGRFDVYGANGKIAKYKEFNLDKGLVIGRVGTVGSVYEINDHAWVSDNAIKAKLASKNNLRFLYYVMKRGRLDSLANQTAHPLLNQGIVGSVRLPIPGLTEQRYTASVLSNVDQAIQKTEEIIEQTQRVKNGLMQNIFHNGFQQSKTKKIRRLGEIPKDWEVKKLEDVCERITDGTHQSPATKEDGYPYVTSKNIRNWGFDLTDLKFISAEDHEKITSRCNPQQGDVLYVKDGANTGNVQVNTLDFEFSLLSSVALIRTNKHELYPYFLEQLFKWSKFRKLVLSQMSGTGIRRLTISKLEKSDVLLPPLDEQKKITKILGTFDDHVKKSNKELEKLRSLKKGLMQDLLTGKVRTNDKDIEVLDEVLEVEKS